MKIRLAFVSNSSTSSYTILGARVQHKELLQLLFKGQPKVVKKHPNCKHTFDRDTMKYCPECGKEAWWEDDPDYDQDDIEAEMRKLGLYSTSHYENWYVGAEIDGWSADKLANEIQMIREKVKNLTGQDSKVYTVVYRD